MADTQIHPTGDVDAPGRYHVPESAELLLKGVYAKFDGSAAASAYKPLVRIISDAGSVALEAVADTEIAAGASADASWFRGGGLGGGSGTGGAVVSAYARRFGLFNFAVGQTLFLFGPGTMHTNDPAVFSIDTGLDRIAAAHGGLILTTMFMSFATTAGTPFTGQFLLTVDASDSTNAPVEGLTQPEIDYAELYATDGGDFFQFNGFGLLNADDTFYTPPYVFGYVVETSTAITATACSFGVTILNPTGLT